MKSYVKFPYEIDEKLKESHNLLSKKIFKTQIFLVLQQISVMMAVLSLFFLFFRLFSFPSYPRLFLILLFSFIGLVIFFLYFIIRYIAESIDIHREYSLKEKQILNYLSEELLLMVKIYISKYRIFKSIWNVRKLRQDNEKSMDEKMRIIFKDERNHFIFLIIDIPVLFSISLLPEVIDSNLRSYSIINPFLLFFWLYFIILVVFYCILTYLVLRYTNKWIKGYHELNVWGELLDKYDIIPKEGYMALLDKDFNNLGFPDDKYCSKCGELLKENAQFCIYCGKRIELN